MNGVWFAVIFIALFIVWLLVALFVWALCSVSANAQKMTDKMNEGETDENLYR